MERGERRGGRGHAGGIAELCQLIEAHGAAIDYDLMTLTRYQLCDLGGALSYGALRHFLQYLPRTSAFSREIQPPSEAELWAEGNATAALLADLIDAVNSVGASLMAKGSGRKPRAVKPYPRPWETKGTQHIGKDPIPVSEFDAWWDS